MLFGSRDKTEFMTSLAIIDRPRLIEQLSPHRYIALSACHGAGKTELIKQFCHRCSEDVLFLTLLPSHNEEGKLVSFLQEQLQLKQWVRAKHEIQSLLELNAALKEALRSYRNSDKKVLILDQCERLTNQESILALSELLYALPDSMRIIISSANHKLATISSQKLAIDWHSLGNNELKFDVQELDKINEQYPSSSAQLAADLYQLTSGHCQTFSVLMKLSDQLPKENLKRHIAQLEVVENIYQSWMESFEYSGDQLLGLPILCRFLFNQYENTGASFSELITALHADSVDNVHFELPELFRYWFRYLYKSKQRTLPKLQVSIDEICEYYCQSGFALKAVEFLAEQDLKGQAAEILNRQLLMLIRAGNYLDADELYQQIGAQLDTSAQLILFGVLIDFHKHGHLYALNRLDGLYIQLKQKTGLSFTEDELQSLQLFHRHCRSMLDLANEGTEVKAGFQPSVDWPLLCWDTHTLATEQLYQGSLLQAEANFLLSFEQASNVQDIPCMLANLSWLYVTHLRTDKLNQYQDLYSQVELTLKQEGVVEKPAFQAILCRIKIFLCIDNGDLTQAISACQFMKRSYSALDPLNQGYCLWAEFLLVLVQGNNIDAFRVLSELTALNIRHYGKWSLALPEAELFKALLDNDDEVAVLRWANRYEKEKALKVHHSYERRIAEEFAYLRIRITLGTDTAVLLAEIRQEVAEGDVLSSLHLIILQLLNADRQGQMDSAQHAMNELLNAYSTYKLRSVYMEYQQLLSPIMGEYKPLPSMFHHWQSLADLFNSKKSKEPASCSEDLNSVQREDRNPILKQLSTRESEVLSLILEAKSNADIAAELGLTEVTIKGHVGRILKKFEVRNRSQLIALQPL